MLVFLLFSFFENVIVCNFVKKITIRINSEIFCSILIYVSMVRRLAPYIICVTIK